MRKGTISLGSIIVSILVSMIYVSLGVLFLSWGTWVVLSGQGARPAMLEYFAIAFGAFLTMVGLIVVVRQVLSRKRRED